MSTPRINHTATLLPDGRVAIVGSALGGGNATVERYDPATGTFSAAGSISVGRYDHTASLLADGRILIAGGSDFGGPLNSFELLG